MTKHNGMEVRNSFPGIVDLPMAKSIEGIINSVNGNNVAEGYVVGGNGSDVDRTVRKFVNEMSMLGYSNLVLEGSKRKEKKKLDHGQYSSALKLHCVREVVDAYAGEVEDIKVFTSSGKSKVKDVVSAIESGHLASLYGRVCTNSKERKESPVLRIRDKAYDNGLKIILGENYKENSNFDNRIACGFIDQQVGRFYIR